MTYANFRRWSEFALKPIFDKDPIQRPDLLTALTRQSEFALKPIFDKDPIQPPERTGAR